MRHGEAAGRPEIEDRQRPLTDRGVRNASRVGSELRDRGELPELIVCSNALRTVATGRAVAAICGSELREEPALYMAGPHAYLETLSRLGDGWETVLAVGHIPGLAELLQLLTGKRVTFTPACLARIDLPIDDWGEILGNPLGELVGFRRR